MTSDDDGTFASDMAWAAKVDAEEAQVNHSATLLERHRITMPVGATGDNVAVARLHAEAYARARGFELAADSIRPITAPGKLPTVGNLVGVEFDVVIARGDISLDQRVPGVLDRWTWGGAVDWWRRIFERTDPRQAAPVVGVVDADGSRRIRPRSGGDPHRPPSDAYFQITKGEIDVRPADAPPAWRGGEALRGPVPGDGPQAGTGELPPWLRRGTDQDPDLDGDDQ